VKRRDLYEVPSPFFVIFLIAVGFVLGFIGVITVFEWVGWWIVMPAVLYFIWAFGHGRLWW
jgi:hypothetical protein